MSGDDERGSSAAGGTSPTEQLIEMMDDPRQKGRPVLRKLHGVAHGRLEMDPNRPTNLRGGVFAHDALPTWVRFSSDAGPSDPDLRSTPGLGLKVFRVPGENALGETGVMFRNHNVFSWMMPGRRSSAFSIALSPGPACRSITSTERENYHIASLEKPACGLAITFVQFHFAPVSGTSRCPVIDDYEAVARVALGPANSAMKITRAA